MDVLRYITVFLLGLCWAVGLYGAEPGRNDVLPSETGGRNVSNSFMIEAGWALRADTYLTPLRYRGWNGALGYEHVRAFKGRPFMWVLNSSFEIDRTQNRARNAVMWGAEFEARWSFLRRWRVAGPVEVGAGGATTVDAGALYLSRNGNNPVAANASWTVGIAAYASGCFRLGKLPVVARYTASLPVAGAMFAPDYGQLYYEIYLGDRKGLVRGAYWGRYFRLDQMLSLDLKVGPKWLRVGYGVDVLSTKVNGIVSRKINHNVVLGLTTGVFSYTK